MKKLVLRVMVLGVLIVGLLPTAALGVDLKSVPPTYAWLDAETIQVTANKTATNIVGEKHLYIDPVWRDKYHMYGFKDAGLPNCQLPADSPYKSFTTATIIDFTAWPNKGSATLITFSPPSTSSSSACHVAKTQITVGDTDFASAQYARLDATRIKALGADTPKGPDTSTYLLTGASFVQQTTSMCKTVINVFSDNRNLSIIHSFGGKASDDGMDAAYTFREGCWIQNDPTTAKLGSVQNAALAAGTGKDNNPTGPGGTGAPVQAVCSVDSLTWLVCPIISVAQGAVNSLTGVVKNQLKFAPLAQGETGLKPAWEVFRGLANIFFVLIFFVVIFGTSLGLDNYTVKKILPRLVAAAVLVQFSYLLVGFMVDITNVLGMGIDSLMSEAIPKGMKTGNEGVMWAVGGLELIGGIAVMTALLPFLAEFAIPLLLTLASAIIALVAVFVTLQIRIMLIDFLIILSPIAFLLWVLPNTDKYFKMWRETLIKLLLMYPIIILLLATSKLFSVIITGAGETSNWTKLSAALAPIIALFLIPATFKFASSALMMGHNFVSGHAKRGHSAIGNAQDKMKQNRAYNRQQKGYGTLNDLSKLDKKDPKTGLAGFGRGAKRRIAQHQAGLGIDKVNPDRIAGKLESNDKERLAGATRKLLALEEGTNGQTVGEQLVDASASSDQHTSIAAVGLLAERNDLGNLQKALHNPNGHFGGKTDHPDWLRATASNYKDIHSRAPHLVSSKGLAAYDDMTPDQVVSLGSVGAQGMVDRRNQLAAAHASAIGTPDEAAAKLSLDTFDSKATMAMIGINNSTQAVNKVKTETRETLNAGLGQHLNTTILDPKQRAAAGPTPQPQPAPPAPQPGPQPQPQPAPPAQPAPAPTQAQQVQNIITQHATQTGTPVADLQAKYNTDQTFKVLVDTAHAHNTTVNEISRAQTPPPSSTPLVQSQDQSFDESSRPNAHTVSGFGEGKKSLSGLSLPNNYPGGRQLVSSRLAPRDQTNEPGDDRSIS